MSITAYQKALIRHTFRRVAVNATVVVDLFYTRLFEVDPSTRAMFTTDMHNQGDKFMQMLALVVASLDQFDTLTPAIKAMGQRHVKYGVKKEHYAMVGEVLMWTLEKGLGVDFTPNTREAWMVIYAMLTEAATQDLPAMPNPIQAE